MDFPTKGIWDCIMRSVQWQLVRGRSIKTCPRLPRGPNQPFHAYCTPKGKGEGLNKNHPKVKFGEKTKLQADQFDPPLDIPMLAWRWKRGKPRLVPKGNPLDLSSLQQEPCQRPFLAFGRLKGEFIVANTDRCDERSPAIPFRSAF